jgi:hypothetical protein
LAGSDNVASKSLPISFSPCFKNLKLLKADLSLFERFGNFYRLFFSQRDAFPTAGGTSAEGGWFALWAIRDKVNII